VTSLIQAPSIGREGDVWFFGIHNKWLQHEEWFLGKRLICYRNLFMGCLKGTPYNALRKVTSMYKRCRCIGDCGSSSWSSCATLAVHLQSYELEPS